jgi:hypothetical protein
MGDYTPSHKVLVDFGLSFLVEIMMIAVSVGIVYVFLAVSTARQRDTVFRNLPFAQRLEWLKTDTLVECSCEVERLVGRLSDLAEADSDVAIRERVQAELDAVVAWRDERRAKEGEMRRNPVARAADLARRTTMHRRMLVALHHKNGELAPCDIEQRLAPWSRYLYRTFLKPNESNYPKIAPELSRKLRFAYGTAAVWCVATSFYVFLYGICGGVEEKQGVGAGGTAASSSEVGEFECSGNGQASGTTRNWVVSFIVFAGVSMAVIKPGEIFMKSVVIPAILCELAEREGILFDEDGRVLLQDNKPEQQDGYESKVPAATDENVQHKTMSVLSQRQAHKMIV